MHTKSHEGFEIHFPGPDLHQDEIDSLMGFLHHLIEEIDDYSDKSLFFQNPQIFEGWLALVRAVEKIETWEAAEDKTKWENRTETYVAYLLTLRDLHQAYIHLGREYYDNLKELLNTYGGWLEGECISVDGIEAISADKYVEDIDGVEDIIQHLTKLNRDSLKARSALHSVLVNILKILVPIINRGGQRLVELNPSTEDFAKAIDDDLREWTCSFGKDMFREMKEELNRHYKTHRTDHNTVELWSEMLDADETALNKAKMHQLAEFNEPRQEHWGIDMKEQMDENGKLMQQILSSCHTEELFDLRMVGDIQRFISLLTPDNLAIFYDIIVRRSLIQCEMFPELKKQHEEWLNKEDKQQLEEDEVEDGATLAATSAQHTFAAAVLEAEKIESVVALMHRYMQGKQEPKDVLMPIRAAIEAGKIRRPSWGEFTSEFPDKVRGKSSFSNYTNPDKAPYSGSAFEAMMQAFSEL